MQFTADEYYRASIERLKQAKRLYHDGDSYALAMYCGGLAVECLLRAFRWRTDATFEGRHDLSELLKASRFVAIDVEYMQRKRASDDAIREMRKGLRTAMNNVIVLWHNNLRFACEASFKAFLRRSQRIQGVKGNPLKKNAKDLIDAAETWSNEVWFYGHQAQNHKRPAPGDQSRVRSAGG